jgi:hypothetical protein
LKESKKMSKGNDKVIKLTEYGDKKEKIVEKVEQK